MHYPRYKAGATCVSPGWGGLHYCRSYVPYKGGVYNSGPKGGLKCIMVIKSIFSPS